MSDNPAVQATQSLVTQIVSGYVKKNQVALADISTVINTVFKSLVSLGKAPEPSPQVPAVSIRQSVRPTHVVCLECGARGKILRRHLRESHRAKWGLSPDHPITAPGYSQERSAFAKKIGLGRRASPRRRRRSSSGPLNIDKRERTTPRTDYPLLSPARSSASASNWSAMRRSSAAN